MNFQFKDITTPYSDNISAVIFIKVFPNYEHLTDSHFLLSSRSRGNLYIPSLALFLQPETIQGWTIFKIVVIQLLQKFCCFKFFISKQT